MLLDIVLVLMLVSSCRAFYLPGLAPQNYCVNGTNKNCKTSIELFVNRLTSSTGQFSYDYNSFDFCGRGLKPVKQNPGQQLFGERIKTSPYKFSFNKYEGCREVCRRSYNSTDHRLEFLKQGILYSYQHWWIIDNMPVSWCYETIESTQFCTPSFSIGCYVKEDGRAIGACVISEAFNKEDTFYIFNHVDIAVHYHEGDEGMSRLVKATLQFRSISGPGCNGPPLAIPRKSEKEINVSYTYSVHFVQENNILWSNRWEYIFNLNQQNDLFWFSSINSFVVNAFLMSAFLILYFKKLKNRTVDNIKMKVIPVETAWESIRCDIFRFPSKPMILSVFVGVGLQIFWATVLTIFLGVLGFLSPANRGALETAALSLFVCFGVLAGYKSARLYKTFERENWILNALATSLLIPGFIFLIFFVLNLIYWGHSSSSAVSPGILAQVVLVWIGAMLPLILFGAYLGQRREKLNHPGYVNAKRRDIPKASYLKKPIVSIILGGMLPFGTIYIQIFFVLNSIWFHQYYYNFSYVLVAAINLTIACALVAILLCYLHLTAEDYRWWWRSFLTPGFTAIYFFIYAFFFFIKNIEVKTFSIFLVYFGITTIMATILFLFTGTVGFVSCYWFLRKIYGKYN